MPKNDESDAALPLWLTRSGERARGVWNAADMEGEVVGGPKEKTTGVGVKVPLAGWMASIGREGSSQGAVLGPREAGEAVARLSRIDEVEWRLRGEGR